jgi:hypothetical protein
MQIELTNKQVAIIVRALQHKISVANGLGLHEYLDDGSKMAY